MVFAIVFGMIWFKVPETICVNLHGALAPHQSGKDVMLWLAGKYGADFALYKALEFRGDGAAAMSIDARITLADHAVEHGGKFGLFEFDDKTAAFLDARKNTRHQLGWSNPVSADADAVYCQTVELDLAGLEPQVAKPHTFENVVPVSEVVGTHIDQAMVGSCANGHLDDMQAVARVVRGRHVHPGTRFIVQPASWTVYRESMRLGLIEIMLDAGVSVISPGCHVCFGMQGTLTDGDVCLTSTTRNHRGRMGSDAAEIYLASPVTVAASALAGEIVHPAEAVKP